jgi:hypothetical protein
VEVLNAKNGEGDAQQIVGDPVALVQVRNANRGAAQDGDGQVRVPLGEEEIVLANFGINYI